MTICKQEERLDRGFHRQFPPAGLYAILVIGPGAIAVDERRAVYDLHFYSCCLNIYLLLESSNASYNHRLCV